MKILVTGGAGYIGSHTCVALQTAGHEVVVVDNLCNSRRETIHRIREISGREVAFHEMDVTDQQAVAALFAREAFDGVIHFAGLKAVGESVVKPLVYYRNNLMSTLVLADMCREFGVEKLVFSSSATVYGENQVPFVETMPLQPAVNPYGATKAMSERILTDAAAAHPRLAVSLLRYFNPVGAHESGLIGEDPRGIPNNLMPYLTQVAAGIRETLQVFGNDYPTPDGTGVRDFIHVMDLAEGHVAAIEQLETGVRAYNLGTGRGTSVLELVKTFERVSGVPVPCEIVSRRPGDIAVCYADATRAKDELGWATRRDLATMCRDAWRFQQRQTGASPDL